LVAMPVTPLHLGPALVAKALLRQHFSLITFTLVQGVIDIESALNLALDRWPVHAHLHTILGSLAVATSCAIAGRPIGTRINGWLRDLPQNRSGIPERMRCELLPVTWTGSIVGAAFGALSHIALDAMMHSDLSPFWPFAKGNPLLLPHGFVAGHVACAILGAVGSAAWWASTSSAPACASPRAPGVRSPPRSRPRSPRA
jgi:hypothetical protein